jgi:23S rRNA (guanosine2251-2'-O)-methyltransferase
MEEDRESALPGAPSDKADKRRKKRPDQSSPPRQRTDRPRGASRGAPPEVDAATVIYGLHAAAFALENPNRRIAAIHLTDNAERRLGDAVAHHRERVVRASPRDLDKRLGPDTVHQGVVLDVEPIEPASLAALIAAARETARPIVILDQVTDPHNVGAVLRSAAVFGAAGIVMTYRHSPPLGGALAKAASGALELTPICLVRNLADAIGEIRAAGLPVIGLDAEGADFLEDVLPVPPSAFALALGAEGKGLRALTRESCDRLCRIGGNGPISSLNVSNAAAIALHLATIRRRRETFT